MFSMTPRYSQFQQGLTLFIERFVSYHVVNDKKGHLPTQHFREPLDPIEEMILRFDAKNVVILPHPSFDSR